jgi:hypothetical protein
MKVLMLVLSGAWLTLVVAACAGASAESAGPAPSVPAPATPPTNTAQQHTRSGYAQAVQYDTRADAICRAAAGKLEAAVAKLGLPKVVAGLPPKSPELDELAFRVSADALAELRALSPPSGPAVNPVALCSHRGATQEGAKPVTRAEFRARASAICDAAFGKLGFVDLGDRRQALRAARIDEEALAELRALPQPEADRALLEESFYAVVDQEVAVLRETAVAIAAGDTARAYLLGEERVHLTHQRDAFAGGYGLGTDGCPVALSA